MCDAFRMTMEVVFSIGGRLITNFSLADDVVNADEPFVFCHMRTTKAQISLRIRKVWSAPLLFAA